MDNITSFNFAIYEKFEKRDIKKRSSRFKELLSVSTITNATVSLVFFPHVDLLILIGLLWFVVFLLLHKQSVLNFESISRVFILTSGFSSGGLAWKKTPRNYAEVKAFRTIHGHWYILG